MITEADDIMRASKIPNFNISSLIPPDVNTKYARANAKIV